jgi:hypothetical protein
MIKTREPLERFPIGRNHLIEKESLRFKEVEHAGIEKAGQLFQNMLSGENSESLAASRPRVLDRCGKHAARLPLWDPIQLALKSKAPSYTNICKSLDLSFPSLSREIATRHSSHGGEFGERIDSVKDASQKGVRKDARRRRRAMARAGEAGAPHP